MHAPGRAQWATALWYSGLSGSILIGIAVRACTRRSRGSCRHQAHSATNRCEVEVGWVGSVEEGQQAALVLSSDSVQAPSGSHTQANID